MSEKELAEINLFSLQGLEFLRDSISKLCLEIVVIKDERDEYKRKWLELEEERKNAKALVKGLTHED